MRHPHALRLMAFFDCELSPRQDQKIARHVERCDHCCETLARFGAVGVSLKGLGSISRRRPDGVVVLADRRKVPVGRATVLAASLIAVLALLALRPFEGSLPGVSFQPATQARPDRTERVVTAPSSSGPLPGVVAPGGTTSNPSPSPGPMADAPTTTASPSPPAGDSTAPPAVGDASPPAEPAPGAVPGGDVPVKPVGVVVATAGRRAELSRQAADAFVESVDLPTLVASDQDALAAIGHLADAGARVIVLPVWPDGLNAADVEALAAARQLAILTSGTPATPNIRSLRPGPEIEARLVAEHLTATQSARVAVFFSDVPEDRAFADALFSELQARQMSFTPLPAGVCATSLALLNADTAVIAAPGDTTEACLQAALAVSDMRMLSRVDGMQGLTTEIHSAAFVSPLNLGVRVSSVSEAEEVSRWAGDLVTAAAKMGGDMAGALTMVSRGTTGNQPAVDLSQPRSVIDGSVVGDPGGSIDGTGKGDDSPLDHAIGGRIL